MKVWVTNDFAGHYPVGTSAVAVAETEEEARALFDAAIKDRGLRGLMPNDRIEELDTSVSHCVILQDGNY